MSPEEWLASQTKQATPAAPAPSPAAAPMSPEQWAASQKPAPSTTATGLAGAATRGLALPAAGAAIGSKSSADATAEGATVELLVVAGAAAALAAVL